MTNKILIAFLLSLCFLNEAFACTTILVGREVSADGSHFIGRTDDSSTLCIAKLAYIPRCVFQKPITYYDMTANLTIKLPKVSYECFAVPTSMTIPEGNASAMAQLDFWWESAINEKRVGISATETINANNEVLKLDPLVNSGLREGNIPRFVIPYVDSAREGVERLAKLVEKYGMMASEAVIFIDDNEIWYMELYTGHHYAAQRLPEDCCACIANDAMLGFYDPKDKKNWIASPDIIEFAKKAGTYKEIDGKFHLALSYGTEKRNYSQLRVWAGRRHFAPSTAGKYDINRQYEIFFKPEKKISLLDAFELTRDRHEGTPQATDKNGNNTRPIGIDRTSQSHFIQFRGKDFSPVHWACLCAPEFSVYFPILGIPNEVPPHFSYYRYNYNPNSCAWKLLEIANFASTDRKTYSKIVRKKFSALEKQFVNSLDSLDQSLNANGANTLLQNVTAKVEKTVDDLKANFIEEITKKRIDSTKLLGNDKAQDVKLHQTEDEETPNVKLHPIR